MDEYLAFLETAFDGPAADSIAAVSRRLQGTRSRAQLALEGRLQPSDAAAPFAFIGQRDLPQGKPPYRTLRPFDGRPPRLLPDHCNGQFPLATAETLAALSDQVYDPLASVAHRLRKNPFVSHVRVFDRLGAEAIGLVYDGRPVLVFRGTEPASLRDWLQDLMVWFKPVDNDRPELRIHSGFLDYLQLLWPAIEAWRMSLPERSTGWLLTGHSLGGAMAKLAAWRLHDSGERIEAVVSFGAPAIGNRAFQAWCESQDLAARIWRVVSGPDIVPVVLPSEIGYAHVGTQISLSEDWHSDETFWAQWLGSVNAPGWTFAAASLKQAWPTAAAAALLLGPAAFSAARGTVAHMREFGYAQSLSRAMALYALAALAQRSPRRERQASDLELVKRHTDLAALRIAARI
ncbi:lipase family protein [Piscinibacter sakaiensis]|uniref:lipase family protein n=1 Tax=Piscinibacter sakaiensis TaxID=1547922 RepID=UPI003AB05860